MVALSFFRAMNASADVAQVLPDMGNLEDWAIFTLGTGNGGDRFTRNIYIEGNVGTAGNARATLIRNAIIGGDLYCRSNGTLQISPDATITGSTLQNQDARLDADAAAAIAVSDAAAALTRTPFFTPTVQLNHNDKLTAVGAPGETVVLQLRNFQLADNSTFTLQGTATTTFVINVRGQFSLSGNAQIILAGGVDLNNVLFNVRGRDSAVSLSDHSKFQGILMANRRTVRMSGRALVNGEIIAMRVAFSDPGLVGSRVIHPPIVSP
jgi:choice-of-anchor A domain-containing protein